MNKSRDELDEQTLANERTSVAAPVPAVSSAVAAATPAAASKPADRKPSSFGFCYNNTFDHYCMCQVDDCEHKRPASDTAAGSAATSEPRGVVVAPSHPSPGGPPSPSALPSAMSSIAPSINSLAMPSPLSAVNNLKRHRSRSRSLPTNLFKVQKTTSRKEKHWSAPLASSAPAPSPNGASETLAKKKLRKLASQPPPVNAVSLREIDLQEIFKNPQLRHDIVFDPQLQFRPNLDGERGKRKKLHANQYWHAVVSECRELSYLYWPSDSASTTTGDNAAPAAAPAAAALASSLSSTSRLPMLFITLRDILLSLLPAKDRAYVESVIDPDLLMQQLRHCALDFVDLARWLANVFKAHCAPMRDSWVDQMVARIELGIQTRSPQRLVEGLRMVFAILEAMKLDVANHQIRTLRPILVDAAVDFEQDYYKQIMEKNKVSLDDAVKWYRQSIAKFDASGLRADKIDHSRSAFVYGLLKIFSCVSDDIVADFPTTFAFDISRLAGFRAEVRKMVCLQLCLMLHQELKRSRLAVADSVKLQEVILAIIGDSSGNSKWTKNTHALALELARRVDGCASGQLPAPATVSVVSGWLAKHLQPTSDVYRMVERKLTNNMYEAITTVMAGTRTTATLADNDNALHSRIMSFIDRLMVLITFHWGVFGKFYMSNTHKSEPAARSLRAAQHC